MSDATALNGIQSLSGFTGVQMQTEVTQSAPNLAALLKKTALHPNGRVQLDEKGEVKGAQNPVLYVAKKPIKVDINGQKMIMGYKEIPVNGGQPKAFHPLTGKQDSVWRLAMEGPKKYHELIKVQNRVRQLPKRSSEQVAPDLSIEEAEEYALYVHFLKKTGKKIAENIEFYEWLKTVNVKVDEDGVVVDEDEEDEPETPVVKKAGRPKKVT